MSKKIIITNYLKLKLKKRKKNKHNLAKKNIIKSQDNLTIMNSKINKNRK